jgi:type VI secretion system protein ImpL
MPDELGQALGNVLLQPITHTGWAASNVLTERLNLRWQDEVVRPFTSRFTGSYPFNSNATETSSFTDVMDFFRPSTGTFWGFYTRVLAPFIVKSGSDWTIVTVGSLTLSFNPAITTALKDAERIRDIFFKPDGTVRSLSITLTPLARNKYTATLSVCGQEVQLTPGGSSATIRWPVDAPAQDATLKVQVGENFTQDISFRGRWGLMQLLQKARVNVLGQSSFDATWEMNVQNMYMAYLTYRIQVAGGDHPFGAPVFAGFDCPTNLTVAQARTAQGQASGAQDVE